MVRQIKNSRLRAMMVNKYYRAGQIMIINSSKVKIAMDIGLGFNNMNVIRDMIYDI